MIKPEQLENAFNIVAYHSLKENGENVTVENVEVESARIERCVEYHFKNSDLDIHFPEFARKFLMDNYNDLIHSDKFLDDYISDVPEPTVQELELDI